MFSDLTLEIGLIFSPLCAVMNMLISCCALIVPWQQTTSSHQNLNRVDKLESVEDLSLVYSYDEDSFDDYDYDDDNSDNDDGVGQILSVKAILRISVKGDISKLIMNSPLACVRRAL